MFRICVIVASHICYDGQLELLEKSLLSLLNQTLKPDIYLAISFENDIYKHAFDFAIYEKYTNINYIISSIRQYQMQHIYHVREYICKYDLIMFCDDDDTYDVNRVHTIYNIYKTCLSQMSDSKNHLGAFVEILDVNLNDAPEFWCYAITPILYNDFYKRMQDDMDLLAYDYGDMYFRNYLRLINNNVKYCSCKFNKPLYNHIKHSQSICGKKESDYHRYVRNVVILLTICMYDVKYITDKLNLTEENLYIYVPELDRIRKIKYKLYDNVIWKMR
jgi:hypothetical protein